MAAKDQVVIVPNIGPVSFPSTMRDEDIARAIQKMIGTQDQSIPTPENLQAGRERAAKAKIEERALEEQTTTPIQSALKTATLGTFDPIAAGQVGASMLSSALVTPYANVKGAIQELRGKGRAEDIAAQTIAQNAYQPTSVTGQNYMEKVSDFLHNLGAEGVAGMPELTSAKGLPRNLQQVREGLPAFETPKTSILGKNKYPEKIPTIEQLKNQSRIDYKKAEDAGIVFKPENYNNFARNLTNTLKDELDIDKELNPASYRLMTKINEKSQAPVSLKNINTLRVQANGIIKSGNAADANAASLIKNHLDDYLDSLDASFIITKPNAEGTVQESVNSLKQGIDAWKRARKAETISDIYDVADIRSGTNFKASGMEQALRQRITNLATNKNKMRLFNPTEQAAIIDVAKGGNVQNMFREVGKYAPTGPVGSGAGVYLGEQLMGEEGKVLFPAISAGARAISGAIAKNKFKDLENLMKMGYLPTQVRGTTSTMPLSVGGLLEQTTPQTDEDIKNLLKISKYQ